MAMPPQNLSDYESDEMDKEAWQCMNSMDRWSKNRRVLDNTLRQGWMQLVSARYEMGPGRISEPLFSLKPQASQTVLEIRAQEADKRGSVVFDLVRTTSTKGQQESADTENKDPSHQNSNPESGLRRRPTFSSAENKKDGLLENSQSHEDPEWEHKPKIVEVQKSSLQGFGALVSPHLRSAQTTFFKALQMAVELVNIRNDALDAHDKYLRLAANMSNLLVGNPELPVGD